MPVLLQSGRMVYLTRLAVFELQTSAVHTYREQTSLHAQLLDTKFQSTCRVVSRSGDENIVLEVILVIVFARKSGLFARLVTPMASSPQVERNARTISATVHMDQCSSTLLPGDLLRSLRLESGQTPLA